MARQPARGKAGEKAIRKSYKSALTELSIEAWRQLKRLAIDQDKPASELQREAINLLFTKHDLPQIAVVGRQRISEFWCGGVSLWRLGDFANWPFLLGTWRTGGRPLLPG
jgi:hypothetical protein